MPVNGCTRKLNREYYTTKEQLQDTGYFYEAALFTIDENNSVFGVKLVKNSGEELDDLEKKLLRLGAGVADAELIEPYMQ